jgi:FecR protein
MNLRKQTLGFIVKDYSPRVFTTEAQRSQRSEYFYEKFFLRALSASAVRYLKSFSPQKRGVKIRNSQFAIRNFLPKSKQTFNHKGREEHEVQKYKMNEFFVAFVCFVVSRYLNFFSLLLAPCSLLFIAVITTLLSAAPAPAQVRQDQAKLANVVGQVEVLRRGTTTWLPAKAGMPLSAGDEVRAAQDSGAEIAMIDGSIVMVFARSRLQIRQLTTETATQTRTSMFHLVVGLVRYVVSQAGVTLVGTRQNQFTISTPTAVMAARGTDGILGYSAAAAVAATPAVPAAAAAGRGGQTTLLCLGGVSALVVLPTVPGTVGTGEQIFCENGQIWNVDAGRLTLLTVLPNSVRAALEAGASPQAIQQIVESMTPVQLTWTPLEQAIYDAAPFNLQGPTQAEVTQVAMAALNTNLPTTTIATAQTTPANIVSIQNFEQLTSGITTTSDVQKVLAVPTSATPSAPSELQ